MELKEQEKFLRIKKEVIKMIENKKEKLKENNIKIDIISDIINDEEKYYILDFESVELLLKNDADPNLKNNDGQSAMDIAVENNNEDLINWLLTKI